MAGDHKLIAEDTLRILKEGFYINHKNERIAIAAAMQQAVDNTKLFTPRELDHLAGNIHGDKAFNTVYEVINETTLDAVLSNILTSENILCLNFASAKNPGGGFLGGAVAQEESITRASALYPCLLNAPRYYAYHKLHKSCLYSDHMIYAPNVPVFKNEAGNVMDDYITVSVITSPAVNAGAVKQNERSNIQMLLPVMEKRMDKLLGLCAYYNHDVLILGAWGCGVFQNEPEDIAALFEMFLKGKYDGLFRKIVFAVKASNERFIEPFRKRFL
ncbi:MAG TPA: TIGR02452 family protein [Parafilimonas sp.]|nr:TIGR02452 family protein [Parafilimonas sp.]